MDQHKETEQEQEEQSNLQDLKQRRDSLGDDNNNNPLQQHHKDSLDEVQVQQQMLNKENPRVLSLSSKPLNGNNTDEPSDIDAEIGFSQAFEEIEDNNDAQDNNNKDTMKKHSNEQIVNQLNNQNLHEPQRQSQQHGKQDLEDSLETQDLMKARLLVQDIQHSNNYSEGDRYQSIHQQQLSKAQRGKDNQIQEILEEEQQYYEGEGVDQTNQKSYNQLENEYAPDQEEEEDGDIADQHKPDAVENYEDSCGIIPPQNVKREATSSTAGFKDIASKRTFDYEQFESFLQAQQQQQQKRKLVYPEAAPDTSPRFSFNSPMFMQAEGKNNNSSSVKRPNVSGIQSAGQKESMIRRQGQEYAFQRDSDMMTVNSDEGDTQKQREEGFMQYQRNGQGSLRFGSQKMQNADIQRGGGGGGSDDERFTNVKEVILDEQQEIPEELQSALSKNTQIQQQQQNQPASFNDPKRLSNTSMATIESREENIPNQASLGISQQHLQQQQQQQMQLSAVKQAVDIKKIVADQVDEIVSARLFGKNERMQEDKLDNEQVFRQIIREELKRFLQQNGQLEDFNKDGQQLQHDKNKKKKDGSISSTPRSLRLSSPRDDHGEVDKQQQRKEQQFKQGTTTVPPVKLHTQQNAGNQNQEKVQQGVDITDAARGNDVQTKKKQQQQHSKSLRDIRFDSNQLTNQEIDVIIEESLQRHTQNKPSWQSTKEINIPQISKKVEFQDQVFDAANQSESSPGFKTFIRNDGSSKRKIEINQVSFQRNNQQQIFAVQSINQEPPMVINHQRAALMSDSRKDYGLFPEISFSVNRLQSNQHISRSNESNGSIVGFSPTLLQNPTQTTKLQTQLLSPIAQGNNNNTIFSMKNPGNIRSAHSRLLSGISRDSSREAIREQDEEGKMMAMMMESSIIDHREGDQQQYQQQSIESVQRLHQAAFVEQQESRQVFNPGYLPSKNARNGNYLTTNKANISPLPILGQEVSSIWEKALEFQARGQLSRAYQLILDIEDDVYLLRLMSISGPCFSKLSQNIGRKLIKRINRIAASKFLDQMSLQLFENTVQMELLSDLNLEDTLSMKEILYDISASPLLGEQASNLYNTIDREEHE